MPGARQAQRWPRSCEIFAAGSAAAEVHARTTEAPPDPTTPTLGLDLLHAARHHLPRHRARAISGLARAYVSGDLDLHGVHPGDPYELLQALADKLDFKRPPAAGAGQHRPLHRDRAPQADRAAAAGGAAALAPDRRRVCGTARLATPRRSTTTTTCRTRFYEWVLGPSMTYTCACYPDAGRHAGGGAGEQVPAGVREAAACKPGDRLLDVGCGWGGMVRYAAAARRQGDRRHAVPRAGGVGAEGDRRGGPDRPRRGPPRRLPRRPRDRTSTRCRSIGLTEHIGVQNYPSYFGFLQVEAAHRRAAAQPLHHPAGQPERARDRAASSTATSSPTGS